MKKTEKFENALKDLANTVEYNLGGTCKISILDINNSEITID